MILGLSNSTAITAIVAGFFVLLALIALLRVALGHQHLQPRRLRIGVFFEREGGDPERDEPD